LGFFAARRNLTSTLFHHKRRVPRPVPAERLMFWAGGLFPASQDRGHDAGVAASMHYRGNPQGLSSGA